jgi:hypothetical protein
MPYIVSQVSNVKAYEYLGRFAVIREYRSHILIYGVIGIACAVFPVAIADASYLVARITWSDQLICRSPEKSQTLRDYPLVKSFISAVGLH